MPRRLRPFAERRDGVSLQSERMEARFRASRPRRPRTAAPARSEGAPQPGQADVAGREPLLCPFCSPRSRRMPAPTFNDPLKIVRNGSTPPSL